MAGSGSWTTGSKLNQPIPAVRRNSGRGQRRIEEMEATVAVLGEDAAAKVWTRCRMRDDAQVAGSSLPFTSVHSMGASFRRYRT